MCLPSECSPVIAPTARFLRVLYCTARFLQVRYCTGLQGSCEYCTAIFLRVQYCTVLHCTARFLRVQYFSVLQGSFEYGTVLQDSCEYCTVLRGSCELGQTAKTEAGRQPAFGPSSERGLSCPIASLRATNLKAKRRQTFLANFCQSHWPVCSASHWLAGAKLGLASGGCNTLYDPLYCSTVQEPVYCRRP